MSDFMSASNDLALQVKRTVGGINPRLFWLNLGCGVAWITIVRSWQVALLQVSIVYGVAFWVAKAHPDLVDIYLKYRKQADSYGTNASPKNWQRNRRPDGFGRLKHG